MKFLIIFSAVIVGAFAYYWDAQELECIEELGINKSDLEDIKDPIDEPTTTDNEKYNQVTECSWKKHGFVDAEGDVDWDAYTKFVKNILGVKSDSEKGTEEDSVVRAIAEELLSETVSKCKDIEGDDVGQKLVKVQNCIVAELKHTPFWRKRSL